VDETTGILNSAMKYPSIRRVVITSSVVAVMSDQALSLGDETTIHTASSRLDPVPQPPFADIRSAYRGAKALALDATDKFLVERNPKFTIVNLMPGYVVGRNEFAKGTSGLLASSNVAPLSVVTGTRSPIVRPAIVSHIDDVARIHVEALDEEKVVGNQNYFIDAKTEGKRTIFDDANEIAKKYFPDAVEEGILKLGGSIESAYLRRDTREVQRIFGELKKYEAGVRDVVGQFVELKRREKRCRDVNSIRYSKASPEIYIDPEIC
jgi:nucleoside-diphosphate-sugar epimerase